MNEHNGSRRPRLRKVKILHGVDQTVIPVSIFLSSSASHWFSPRPHTQTHKTAKLFRRSASGVPLHHDQARREGHMSPGKRAATEQLYQNFLEVINNLHLHIVLRNYLVRRIIVFILTVTTVALAQKHALVASPYHTNANTPTPKRERKHRKKQREQEEERKTKKGEETGKPTEEEKAGKNIYLAKHEQERL